MGAQVPCDGSNTYGNILRKKTGQNAKFSWLLMQYIYFLFCFFVRGQTKWKQKTLSHCIHHSNKNNVFYIESTKCQVFLKMFTKNL